MGRAGSGGRAGGHSSSGHSMGTHSSSGHRMGSGASGSRPGSGSGRAGAGSGRAGSGRTTPGAGPSGMGPGMGGGGFGGAPRRTRMSGNRTILVAPPPPRSSSHGPDGGYGHVPRRSGRGCFLPVLIGILFVLLLIGIAFGASSQSTSVSSSTHNREKLNVLSGFQNDCIVDEIGWFDNISRTETKLQNFYEKTGVQPYIVLKAYDASLTTDEEKDAYAEQYYVEHIDNEGTLLYMYFSELDTDYDVGYMTCINGTQIGTVMDSEALDIFWDYLDSNWYSDLSTDDMFVQTFNSTANRIMSKSTTSADVMKIVLLLLVVVVVCITIVYMIKLKIQRDKEKAEETERILSTPLSSADDDLVNKYTENNQSENNQSED